MLVCMPVGGVVWGGIRGELGLVGWSLGSLWVVLLVCSAVVVLCFVVVLFFLSSIHRFFVSVV